MPTPLTLRAVAGLLATPGCERRSGLVASGVDLDLLAIAGWAGDNPPAAASWAGDNPPAVKPAGQSPFALARSAQFQARLQSDGYARLRELISEHLGVDVGAVRSSELTEASADTSSTLHIVPGRDVPWGDATVATDDLLVVSGERLHLVGVRTYAMVGGVADPAKVAATSRELAVLVLALRTLVTDADRLSTRTLLVLPRNYGLRPAAAVLDVAPQVARVRLLHARLEWGGPAPEPAELAPKFGDGCPQCPLMERCAGELTDKRLVARLGGSVANVVPGQSTVDDALIDPPPDQKVRLRLRAMQQDQAVRSATVRHVHLAEEPLVVVGYHLAGEPAAVVALQYGRSLTDSRLLVAAEPRDREQRMALLASFAVDLSAYLGGFEAVEPVVRRDMTVVECNVDAPQIVVPNGATGQWLTDLLGRYLRISDDPALGEAGRQLGWFAGRRVLPGASAVLAATDLLTLHWTTGQLPAEDAHLGSLLRWIAGTPDPDVPAGPVSDPHWDASSLAPALGSATAVQAALAPVADTAWQQTWAALALLRSEFPAVGAHVAERWERDRWSFTAHRQRMADGTAGTAARLSGVPAYRFLHELETRTVALERQMALDDPLVMAGYELSGDALQGIVSKVDREHTLASPTGRELLRPRIWVSVEADFDRPLGTQLWLASDPKIMVTVAGVELGIVELIVQKGAIQRTALQRLPQIGDAVVFSPFGAEDVFPSKLPEELPWQFGPPPADDE
jgi:hypothetical protein